MGSAFLMAGGSVMMVLHVESRAVLALGNLLLIELSIKQLTVVW